MSEDVQPQLFTTSRAEAALFRFPPLFFVLVGATALALQAYLPVTMHLAVYLDLPLWVIFYWGISLRQPAGAALTGAVIGLAQDSLAHVALGLNGIALTLAGYLTASLGTRIDSDHAGVRFSLVFLLYLGVRVLVYALGRYLLGNPWLWSGAGTMLAAFVNACLAVVVLSLMDRFRRRL